MLALKEIGMKAFEKEKEKTSIVKQECPNIVKTCEKVLVL